MEKAETGRDWLTPMSGHGQHFYSCETYDKFPIVGTAGRDRGKQM